METLRIDNQLCFALYSATRAMTQAYRPALEALGLTYPQYLAFLVLWEKDGIPLKELGQKLALDSGTLTPLIKRMEKSGWVQRQRDPNDERRIQITLTAKGQALKDQAHTVAGSVLCRISDPEQFKRIARMREELKALTRWLKGDENFPGGKGDAP
jgi:DNA-binding MarR family transcriptional regulator